MNTFLAICCIFLMVALVLVAAMLIGLKDE